MKTLCQEDVGEGSWRGGLRLCPESTGKPL